jgi:hypothetical protein
MLKTSTGGNGSNEWQTGSDEDFEHYIEHGEDPFENLDDKVYEDPDQLSTEDNQPIQPSVITQNPIQA